MYTRFPSVSSEYESQGLQADIRYDEVIILRFLLYASGLHCPAHRWRVDYFLIMWACSNWTSFLNFNRWLGLRAVHIREFSERSAANSSTTATLTTSNRSTNLTLSHSGSFAREQLQELTLADTRKIRALLNSMNSTAQVFFDILLFLLLLHVNLLNHSCWSCANMCLIVNYWHDLSVVGAATGVRAGATPDASR